MKTLVWGLFAAVAITFAFQNCKKNSNSAENANLNSVTKLDLGQENMLGANLYADDIQTVQKAGNSFQVKFRIALKINLQTGVITQSSDINPQENTYCLTENLKNELMTILSSSQVCRTHRVLPADNVCTQQYLMPYAELITDKEQIDLGSAADGCATDSVDLCDEQSVILKQYLESLKSSYQQLSCTP